MFGLHSYLGIILVLVLTGCGLPVPEEVPIVTAGVLSSDGTLHWGLALGACILGALLGDTCIYMVGYHFGHSLMRRHPRFGHLLHAEHEAKTEQLIQKHGLKVLFIARFMVGIRAPVYLAAGTLRMPFRRFLVIDTLCASAVVGLFFGMSYAFGDTIVDWIHRGEIALTLLVALAVVAVMTFTWLKGRQLMTSLEAESSAQAASDAGDEDSMIAAVAAASHELSRERGDSLPVGKTATNGNGIRATGEGKHPVRPRSESAN